MINGEDSESEEEVAPQEPINSIIGESLGGEESGINASINQEATLGHADDVHDTDGCQRVHYVPLQT